ncbi:MAG: hypothetical protein ACLR9P_00390 [Escherichia coli]
MATKAAVSTLSRPFAADPVCEHASHHRFRLAIDRAFTVKGAGLVVTGPR